MSDSPDRPLVVQSVDLESVRRLVGTELKNAPGATIVDAELDDDGVTITVEVPDAAWRRLGLSGRASGISIQHAPRDQVPYRADYESPWSAALWPDPAHE
jgi:hypothetical protein